MATPRYFPHQGGVEMHVRAIAEWLAGAGVEVEVFTTDPGGQLPPEEAVRGVLVRRYAVWAPNDAFYVSAPHLLALARQRRAFDLIHAHSYQALTCLNAAIAAGRSLPFVFTPHYHGQGETPLRNLLHLPWRVPGRWLFKRSQRIICVSSAERLRLERRFPHARTVVIPNGVRVRELHAAMSEPPYPAEGPVILYVGRLEGYKNVDRLVASAAYLPEGYRVVIVGDGTARHDLVEQAERAQGGDRVLITGQIPDDELFRWYRTADICVNLSSSEAFGISVLESLAVGKPIVVSDIPAFRELSALSSLVHLVDLQSMDPQRLARTLVSATDDRTAPPDLTGYTWEEIGRKTLAVYTEALEAAA
jgi:glycosyltransferase involved in cell wall biosynthesis